MRLAIGIFLAMCGSWLVAVPATALDPARSIGQYKRTTWTIDNGAPRSISALAQGPSGYLWIGTGAGLYRFDGVTFAQILYPTGGAVPGISTLMISREGDVWVGFSSGGAAVFRGGVLRELPMPDPDYVMDLVQTPDRSIWAMLGREGRQLARFKGGRWTDVTARYGFPTGQPRKMIAGRNGTIWVTMNESLVHLRRDAPRFEPIDIVLQGAASLAEDKDGNIWLSDRAGSRALATAGLPRPNARTISYPSPTADRRVRTLFDRDGNIWGIWKEGLFRVRTPRVGGSASRADAESAVTRFGQADGMLAKRVTALLEDREGNIWAGTVTGLERFRPARVVREPALVNGAFWGDVLLSGSDGSVYVGEADGVYRVRPGGPPEMILRAQEPQALCEGKGGTIWIVLQDHALRLNQGRFNRIDVPDRLEHKVADCAVDRFDRLWLAAGNRGLYGRVNGSWRQVIAEASLAAYPPKLLQRRRDGTFLVTFESNSVATFDPPHAPRLMPLPPPAFGSVRGVYEGRDGLMIGGTTGLGLVRGGRLHTISAERYPLLRSVAGIVETRSGQTWMSSSAGIVGVSTVALAQAFADRRGILGMMSLDFRDGMIGVQSRDSDRVAVQGGDGRIWFANNGAVWIDPSRMWRNTVSPPTAISELTANGVTHPDPSRLTLPAGTSRLEISYSALSLSIPERVQVRYMLEGADRGWIDPGMRRQAFYTNLGPGHYVFRVIAANDDGVWNRVGTRVEFDIPPTFLQSKLFFALCVLGLCALLWSLYRLRILQLQAKMRTTLEERLAERERIARDLHDTLLQGFQGLILRFQSVANQIPEGERTRAMIEKALDSADDVLSEGRDSVLQLRAASVTDVSEALAAVAERLRGEEPIDFKLVVEGVPRSLHPVVREEICRIGEEALINSFQHANAKAIEVAIAYGASAFTLGVRDDGVGIAADIFESGGRQGHFGLTGMRERADQIDADFSISSRTGAGTEIRVTVPGRVAFVENRGDWLRRLFGRRR